MVPLAFLLRLDAEISGWAFGAPNGPDGIDGYVTDLRIVGTSAADAEVVVDNRIFPHAGWRAMPDRVCDFLRTEAERWFCYRGSFVHLPLAMAHEYGAEVPFAHIVPGTVMQVRARVQEPTVIVLAGWLRVNPGQPEPGWRMWTAADVKPQRL